MPESSRNMASTADELEMPMPSTPPDSLANFSEHSDNLERLKGWVYERMSHLQEVGPEGQRILDQDELRIDGTTDVVYRLGQEFILRGHRIIYRGSESTAPDLGDHAYWEAKFDFFRREATRIKETSLAKSAVYHAMRHLQCCGPAGQHILDSDELYIAAPFDVRCREGKTHDFELQDPYYWHSKIEYFEANCYRLTSVAPPARHTSPMRGAACLPSIKRKRSHIEEAEVSTVADGRNKRRRFSYRGPSPQQTDRSHIKHSCHSSTASTPNTQVVRPTQGLFPDRHTRPKESAATGFPGPLKSHGRGKRQRAPRRAEAPSNQAIGPLLLTAPLQMPRTRQGQVPPVQPRRRPSIRRVDCNTVEMNCDGGSLPNKSQPRRQTRAQERGKQRSSERPARWSRRLAGYKPEFRLDGRA